MAKTALVFGSLLILLGVATYFIAAADQRSATALIPAAVGVLIALCGLIATNPAARKHAMHVAAMLGTLGFLAAAGRIASTLAKTGTLPDGLKLVGMGGMALLCGAFVALCVRSFIAARKARDAETPGFTAA